MLKREQLDARLAKIDHDLKALIITYEKFFAGLEKREPYKERDDLTKLVRSLIGVHITQADIKFRLQSLTAKFNTYSQQWDRQLKLLEEGKLRRQVRPGASSSRTRKAKAAGDGEFDSVYSAYQQASGGAPNREKFDTMLQQQKDKLRAKYGDRKFEFAVVTENGKPKIKVRSGK
ncbi:MAG: hypothetical protein C0624_03325 [Desulfuromonas sp.]|nr:MAG: hypothetical protein C0624_03325 [Desulfuromonas sp.]